MRTYLLNIVIDVEERDKNSRKQDWGEGRGRKESRRKDGEKKRKKFSRFLPVSQREERGPSD